MKIELNKGQEYDIELYPTDKIVTGRYLGEAERKYFFESEDSYIIADTHWADITNGIITYNNFSSSVISAISKDKISKIEDKKTKSGLLKVLNETKKQHG